MESRFGTLKSILSPRSLLGVGGGVGSGAEFGHRDGADGNFDRERGHFNLLEFHEDRGVEETAGRARVRQGG
jgi:hypothetical protein